MKHSLLPADSLGSHQTVKQKIYLSKRKRRVIVISGPTAAGKTDLSLSIAQSLGGEVVSADSCQVYRGMDIGTAKATVAQRALVTHHLIDICDLEEVFNVAEFYKASQEIFREIFIRGNVPIVVGGSGFYIHTLLYGPPQGPPSSVEVRKVLEEQMRELGPEALYEKLQMLDPEYAKTIGEKDRHKIIRALEIMTIAEKRVSDFPPPKTKSELDYDFRCWFLHPSREKLYERIDKRCDEMMDKGFLEEVRALEKMGLRDNPSAAQAIGYRQALQFLDSKQTAIDRQVFIAEFKKATRHFAKRQFTWFRKEPLFRWIPLDDYPEERVKEMILQDFEQGPSLL